jgi:hypothetical protein
MKNNVYYICNCCDKKAHLSAQEAKFCKLYHEHRPTDDMILEYLELQESLKKEHHVIENPNLIISWSIDKHKFVYKPRQDFLSLLL